MTLETEEHNSKEQIIVGAVGAGRGGVMIFSSELEGF